MTNTSSNVLNELLRWSNNINYQLQSGTSPILFSQAIQRVSHLITTVAYEIRFEYPYYSKILPEITSILFYNNGYGAFTINIAAFGEIYFILHHLEKEPHNMCMWSDIHPRIEKISSALFSDGYYDAAAEKAIKEVETRLREKFSELKPEAFIPSNLNEIIGTLFSESGIFHFCDTSSTSGKNHRKGIHQLFEGIIAAYRNPSAHANITYTRHESFEQITLASQLMYILDKPLI